jgi:hypothetical protein
MYKLKDISITYLIKIITEKFPNLDRQSHPDTGGFLNTKQARSEKKDIVKILIYRKKKEY